MFVHLPVFDLICALSLVNTTFLALIRGQHSLILTGSDSDDGGRPLVSHLWHYLVERDFSAREIQQLSAAIPPSGKPSSYLYTLNRKLPNHLCYSSTQLCQMMMDYDRLAPPLPSCPEMQQYIRLYLQFRHSGYRRVANCKHWDDDHNRDVKTIVVRFISRNSHLNRAVLGLLRESKWTESSAVVSVAATLASVDEAEEAHSVLVGSSELTTLYFEPARCNLRPSITLELYSPKHIAQYYTMFPEVYFQECHGMVIAIDASDACRPRNHSVHAVATNTLDMCVRLLYEMRQMMQVVSFYARSRYVVRKCHQRTPESFCGTCVNCGGKRTENRRRKPQRAPTTAIPLNPAAFALCFKKGISTS